MLQATPEAEKGKAWSVAASSRKQSERAPHVRTLPVDTCGTSARAQSHLWDEGLQASDPRILISQRGPSTPNPHSKNPHD